MGGGGKNACLWHSRQQQQIITALVLSYDLELMGVARAAAVLPGPVPQTYKVSFYLLWGP